MILIMKTGPIFFFQEIAFYRWKRERDWKKFCCNKKSTAKREIQNGKEYGKKVVVYCEDDTFFDKVKGPSSTSRRRWRRFQACKVGPWPAVRGPPSPLSFPVLPSCLSVAKLHCWGENHVLENCISPRQLCETLWESSENWMKKKLFWLEENKLRRFFLFCEECAESVTS